MSDWLEERKRWGSEPMEPTPEPEQELPAGYIYVLYNATYGGFGWSKRARDELMRRGYRGDPYYDDETRTDPIAVAVFNEMGTKWCSGQYCKMQRTKVPEKYLKYMEISEYDGNEGVCINYDAAFTQGVRKLLDDETATLDDIREYVTGIENDRGYKFYYPRDEPNPDVKESDKGNDDDDDEEEEEEEEGGVVATSDDKVFEVVATENAVQNDDSTSPVTTMSYMQALTSGLPKST